MTGEGQRPPSTKWMSCLPLPCLCWVYINLPPQQEYPCQFRNGVRTSDVIPVYPLTQVISKLDSKSTTTTEFPSHGHVITQQHQGTGTFSTLQQETQREPSRSPLCTEPSTSLIFLISEQNTLNPILICRLQPHPRMHIKYADCPILLLFYSESANIAER